MSIILHCLTELQPTGSIERNQKAGQINILIRVDQVGPFPPNVGILHVVGKCSIGGDSRAKLLKQKMPLHTKDQTFII